MGERREVAPVRRRYAGAHLTRLSGRVRVGSARAASPARPAGHGLPRGVDGKDRDLRAGTRAHCAQRRPRRERFLRRGLRSRGRTGAMSGARGRAVHPCGTGSGRHPESCDVAGTLNPCELRTSAQSGGKANSCFGLVSAVGWRLYSPRRRHRSDCETSRQMRILCIYGQLSAKR